MFRRATLVALASLLCAGCISLPKQDSKIAPEPRGAPEAGAIDAPRNMPMDALRTIAADIEKQVAAGNREPKLESTNGITVDTPEIRQAVRTRAARIELVRKLLDSGNAWERRNGRIWILRTPEYKKTASSRQRDIDAIMVNGENSDRWAIYEGILNANKLGRGGLSAIEQIFFEARLPNLKPGTRYETTDGKEAKVAATE